MERLSTKLDEISKSFFTVWRAWRYDQGWRLGPDLPSSLLSPFMVDNWDQLHENGRTWFRQHAALVLVAVEQNSPSGEEPAKEPVKKERVATKLAPINL